MDYETVTNEEAWEEALTRDQAKYHSPNRGLVRELAKGRMIRVRYPDSRSRHNAGISIARLAQCQGFTVDFRLEDALTVLYKRREEDGGAPRAHRG